MTARPGWLRRVAVPVGRVVLSLGLLALLASTLEVGELGARLRGLDAAWAVAALALSVVQVVASAWRWRFTAGRLGLRLPLRAAVGEYYLATFLNQLLPGGVVGDVSRAWRHARELDGAPSDPGRSIRARAVHAVVLERASGQVVMLAVAALSAGVLLAPGPAGSVPGPGVALWSIPVGAAVVGLAVWGRRRLRERASDASTGSFTRSLDRALLAPRALGIQLLTSAGVVASYVATYVVAARALGVETSWLTLAALVPPVLVTMLLPVTVAGWGLREAAAAALWSAVGFTAAEGVAISVTYGLLVLVGSAPGLVVLAFRRRRRRDPRRRPDRSRAARVGQEDATPRPASRSPAG